MFQDPKPEDGGAYKCTASNEMGESNANITLNFSGKFDLVRSGFYFNPLIA